MTRTAGLEGILGVLLVASAAGAASYSGSLSYTPPPPADGVMVYAGGRDWPEYSITMSWTVIDEDNTYPLFPWKYSYAFTVAGTKGAISHLILETTEGLAVNDFAGLTGATLDPENPIGMQETGSPYLPEPVYGIRFNPPSSEQMSMTWSFFSNRAPVWGDFYVRDGLPQGQPNVAWNTGFTTPNDVDPTDGPANGSVSYHILRPDGVSGPPIPEPFTMATALLAIAGFGLYVRRHTRKPGAAGPG